MNRIRCGIIRVRGCRIERMKEKHDDCDIFGGKRLFVNWMRGMFVVLCVIVFSQGNL